VLQTSAVAAVLYFFLALLVCIPLFLVVLIFPEQKSPFQMLGPVFICLLPFLYAILGFIMTLIMCLFYNLVAHFMGGIAFSLEEKK
jgi:hypothetical protein